MRNVFVYGHKLLQVVIVRSDKDFGLLTGQKSSKNAELFEGTVI